MYAEQLNKDGVTVIPLFTPEETSILKELYRDTIFDFPEYKTPEKCEKLGHSMGGFSALANGQSFHAPFMRYLREFILDRTVPKLWNDMIGEKPDTNLELLIDRALYRTTDRKVSPEDWHQDLPDKKAMRKLGKVINPDDIVYGGWLNLDDFDQYFMGIKGTQHDNYTTDGFARITKKRKPHYKNLAQAQGKIRIPPGCLIIFYESIVHNVTHNKIHQPMHRQFIGWRITKDKHPYFPDTIQRCKDQVPIRLKSGQEPPMYSRMHLTNWIDRVEKWSENIKDEFCYDHTVQSGKFAGRTFRICKRYLNQTPYKTYEYDQHELDLLKPSRSFKIMPWEFNFEGETITSCNGIGPPGTPIPKKIIYIEKSPEVRDITEDIQFEERQRKQSQRDEEIDLTRRKRRRRV